MTQVMGAIEGLWRDTVIGQGQVPGVPEVRLGPYWTQVYLDNIRRGEDVNIPDAGMLRYQVVCAHRIASDVEYGRPPYDMKPALLGGKAHRETKKGKRYTIIPFRHGVPGTQLFTPMPKDIYAKAFDLESSHTGAGPMRAFRASTTAGGGRGHGRLVGYRRGVKWNGRLTGTEGAHPPRLHQITMNRQTGAPLATPIRYQHKRGIYEGMVRFEQNTAKGRQSTYVTFRTVSDNSDPQSWFHPGWSAHGIADGIVRALALKVYARLEQAAKLDLVSLENLSVGMRLVRA